MKGTAVRKKLLQIEGKVLKLAPLSPNHQPANVSKEEASVGIVRITLALTALVVDPDRTSSQKLGRCASRVRSV